MYGVTYLVRSAIYSAALRRRTTTNTEFNLLAPDLVTVDTNFHGLVEEVDRAADLLIPNLEEQALQNAAGAFATLVGYRVQDLRANREMQQIQRAASDANWEGIDRAIRIGTAGVQVSTAVRDISATTLLVGATVLTGGAAAAVLGVGAGLDATATYQDGGTVGEAVLTATTDIVLGSIGMRSASAAAQGEIANAALARATASGRTGAVVDRVANVAARRRQEQTALLFVGAAIDANAEGIKGMCHGATLAQSARVAGVRFAVDLGGPAMGRLLNRTAVPVMVRMAPRLERPVVDTLTGELVTQASNQTVNLARPPQPAPRADASRPPYADCTRLWNGQLLPETEFVSRTALRRAS